MSTIERVSDSSPSTPPALDVVFLHGLDGDPVKTWAFGSREETFWPRWLAQDNPQAAVWCVGFDASASRWRGGAMGILDRSLNLLARLQSAGIGNRPLCLVGHSLGGLMAKQILVQAAHTALEYQPLAAHARGVVFLATPHDGASIAGIAEVIKLLRPTELLGNLVNDDPGLRHLSMTYRTWATAHGVRHLVFFETHPHRILKRLIVPASSADPKLHEATPIPIDADHTFICKPERRDDLVYAKVNRFVGELMERSSTLSRPSQVGRPTVVRSADDQAKRLETHDRVFRASGWSATLRRLYPRYDLLEFAGAEFPIWVKPATSDQWDDLDVVLGELMPGEDPRHNNYPGGFDPDGARIYWDKLAHVDLTSSYNGATYALNHIQIDGNSVTIHARHGTYFHSLATSEVLDRELVDKLAEDPDGEIDLDSLPRRKWLHDVANGQHVVLDGRHRAAALSVAATLLIAEPDGTYSAMLARRSQRVETHQLLSHVAPAGIFAPINAERREEETEFSVRNCIMREYAEELFGYKDLEQGDGLLGRNVMALPPIRELLKAEQEGIIALRYCGISVPLTTLRPEIYVLVFIKDADWLDQEILRANDTDHWFELNWEYETVKDFDAVKLRLDSNLRPIDPSEVVHPSRMVPHAAAALHLSSTVAHHLIHS
jgi:hypothetical protein